MRLGGTALLPAANKDKIPLLAMAVVPGFSKQDDYGFRLMGVASGFSAEILNILQKQMQKKKVALIYADDDYGNGYAENLIPELKKQESFSISQSYIPGTTDYRPQLLKIKSAAPDAIILGSWAQEAILILKQAQELQISTVIYVCPGACDNPDLIQAGSPATDKVLIVASNGITSAERSKRFKSMFNETPTSVALRFFDSIFILKNAYNNCRNESELNTCLKNMIALTPAIEGASYPVSFDINGDIKEIYQLKIIRAGSFHNAVISLGKIEAE
jgi:branched-chain amino acid transport system substrate-binding protein